MVRRRLRLWSHAPHGTAPVVSGVGAALTVGLNDGFREKVGAGTGALVGSGVGTVKTTVSFLPKSPPLPTTVDPTSPRSSSRAKCPGPQSQQIYKGHGGG